MWFALTEIVTAASGTDAAVTISFPIDTRSVFAKQQSDAPQAGKTYDGVDDAADAGSLTAENPCHKIKARKADQPPVDRADNGENQR